MTQSPEYPDLLWMPPASWTDANRTSVQLIVIHTTEGSEGPTSAEDGATYDQRRTDGTSTHYFHDSDSTVQCVRTADIAHAARYQGNRRGIQHELCGRAGQGATGWADAASQGTLRQAAKQCARDAAKWGIPVRHLTVAEVADGVKGFCGHYDITRAFPQDNGTHTDPGPDFPWSQFLDLVRAEMEDDVSWEDDVITNPAWRADSATNRTVQAKFALYAAWDEAHKAGVKADAVGAKVDKALAQLGDLAAKVGQVDDELFAKLSDPTTPDEQVAAALAQLLGSRASTVLPLIQSYARSSGQVG